MFAECTVNQMFPTCVWDHRVKDHQALNERLAEVLLELREGGTATAADKTAWQSRGNLHTLEEFQPLVEVITAATTGVLISLSTSTLARKSPTAGQTSTAAANHTRSTPTRTTC